MSLAPDNLLPANAKYFGFIDTNRTYNPEYDIVWSFQYAISGTEAGFATFLTNSPPNSGLFPGQYLGCTPTIQYLNTESGEVLMTESEEPIELEGGIAFNTAFSIAFDSTGLFALSSDYRTGVALSQVRPNSLIIRDGSNNITLNTQLSALNTRFCLLSSAKRYSTIRIRYTNMKNVYVDFKLDGDTNYTTLTSVSIPVNTTTFSAVNIGFSYSSPVSSMTNPSVLFFKNFHTEGLSTGATVETIPFTPL